MKIIGIIVIVIITLEQPSRSRLLVSKGVKGSELFEKQMFEVQKNKTKYLLINSFFFQKQIKR